MGEIRQPARERDAPARPQRSEGHGLVRVVSVSRDAMNPLRESPPPHTEKNSMNNNRLR